MISPASFVHATSKKKSHKFAHFFFISILSLYHSGPRHHHLCLDHWALPIQPRVLDAFILLLSLNPNDTNHSSVPPVWQALSCLRAFALAVVSVGNVLSSSPLPSSFVACLHLHIQSLFKYCSHKAVFPDTVSHLAPHPVSYITVLCLVPPGTSPRVLQEGKKY